MAFQQPNESRRIPSPQQFYNQAFVDTSLERNDYLPVEGTQYELAAYGHPDRIPVPTDIPNQSIFRGQFYQRNTVQPENHDLSFRSRRIPSPRPDMLAGDCDQISEHRRIPQPVTNLSQGGTLVFHHQSTTCLRYGQNQASPDEMAMENLLICLPSRQLEAAASNAAKSLQRRSTKLSTYGMLHYGMTARGLDDEAADELDGTNQAEVENAIRGIPATMAAKRSLKRKLSSRKRRAPNMAKRMKYSIGMWWKHFKQNLAEIRYFLDLWHSHLTRIEGNFGSDVLSYFLFLKWLLLINIPTLLLTVGFIVIPQALHRWFQQEPRGYHGNTTFTGLELLTGEGWFTDTELYYGFYTNGSIQLPHSDKQYDMYLAYLFTCGGYYLLTLFILGQSTLKSYKQYYIEVGDIYNMQIILKVLGSWNFGLTSAEAIKLKQKSIYNEIKECMFGRQQKHSPKNWKTQCKLFGRRVFTNLFCVLISAGCTYLVYFIATEVYNRNFNVKTSFPFALTAGQNDTIMGTLTYQLSTTLLGLSYNTSDNTSDSTSDTSNSSVVLPPKYQGVQHVDDKAKNRLLLLVLPFCLGAIHLILPLIFSLLERFEKFEDPKVALFFHLFRSMLLRLATISICVVFWYKYVATEKKDSLQCWETYMGQDLYRLVIVDFIFMLLGTFFAEFVRGLVAGAIPGVQHPTFAIARNTLELIYAQGLCWIGTFYAPLLTCIAMIKLILMFYIKMISVMRNCKPSERPWRATQTHTVFLAFLIVFFLCASTMVAVGIIFISPSSKCGPFQDLDKMYQVVPNLVKHMEESHQWLANVIKFISSPGFIGAVLAAFATGVYLVRTIMVGRRDAVKRLKIQRELESKDKTFLLNLLNQVSQQHRRPVLHEAQKRAKHSASDSLINSSSGARVFVRQMAETVISPK